MPIVIIRLLLILNACLASYVVCSLVGDSRSLMLLAHKLIGRVLLFGFGVWPGLLSGALLAPAALEHSMRGAVERARRILSRPTIEACVPPSLAQSMASCLLRCRLR